jgi:hypothetical protein
MVGQAVGATGESPKDDRQDARRHQILFLFAITFENLYKGRRFEVGDGGYLSLAGRYSVRPN